MEEALANLLQQLQQDHQAQLQALQQQQQENQQFQQNMQQQYQQALQQILAAQPQQPPAQPPAPQRVYAVAPARGDVNNFIDVTTSDGMKIFKAATDELTYKYDGKAENAIMFTEILMERAILCGWGIGAGDILTITIDANTTYNLIREYGCFTMEQLEEHVRGYVLPQQGQQAAQQNRRVQNDYQLFVCLSNSLTEAGRLKVLAETERYTINGHKSGSLFFKLLMKKAVIDTRATANHYRMNLINLDSYMSVVDSNIQLFNQYVKINRDGLKSRGQHYDDIMINLFRGYMHAMDQEFVRYIKDKKDQYDDGADMDEDRLMELALNKYENLVTEGKWRALSPADEKLEALNATVDKLKDLNLRLSKSLKAKQQKGKGDKDAKGKDKAKKKSNKNKKRQNEDMSWKKKPPKEGEPTSKKVQDKMWYWCLDHLAWVMHEPSECRLAKERTSNNRSTPNQQRRTSLNQAVNAILEHLNDDDE